MVHQVYLLVQLGLGLVHRIDSVFSLALARSMDHVYFQCQTRGEVMSAVPYIISFIIRFAVTDWLLFSQMGVLGFSYFSYVFLKIEFEAKSVQNCLK